MPISHSPKRKIGLLSLTAIIAALVWVACGMVLAVLLGQQAQLEDDAQHIYDVSSAKVSEATRTIRALERLAREGDALNWITNSSERTARGRKLHDLIDDTALQGEPELREVVQQAIVTLDTNLADLNQHGAEAQTRAVKRWEPVMQLIVNRSEAMGAEVAGLATNEADHILESTGKARAMILIVAGAVAVGTIALFVFVHFMLTLRVVRLARLLDTARDGAPILGKDELILELQVLRNAAVALGGAHRELDTVRVQLEEMAHTDALTGLANRRMFEIQGQQAFAHARRHSEMLAVIVFDIDHFKLINDQYGHEGGDVVLRTLGKYMLDSVRSSERPAARIGGEEFALLVSHTSKEDTLVLAERLRQGIAALQVHMPNGQSLTFTASLGVAYCNDDDSGLTALLRRADMALYQAKHKGRNRVEQAI
jgi:diguanylate cyclase (GGDEF)-like protein